MSTPKNKRRGAAPVSETEAKVARERMRADVAKTQELYKLIHGSLRLFAWVGIAWITKEGVVEVAAHSPEQIGATARLLESFSNFINARTLFPWALFLLSIVVIFIQHHRIKRLIQKLGDCRRQLEANDPIRSSSGLTRHGETPPLR